MNTEKLWGINKKKKNKTWHSRAYHRYFEDYAERKEYRADGSYKIRRVYVGRYYRQDLPDNRWIWNKVLYFAAALAVVIFSVFGETRPISANHALPVIAIQTVNVISFIWLFFTMLSYLTAEREMKVRTYRESSIGLKNCTKCLAVLLLATPAVTIIVQLVSSTGNGAAEDPMLLAVCTVSELAGSGMCWILNRLENRMKYVTRNSDEKEQSGDKIIRY